MRYIIGIDFDNTIAGYDEVMCSVAVREGLLPPGTGKTKREIRDMIRRLPDGERKWRTVQAFAYGPCIGDASLIDGVWDFIEMCKRQHWTVVVVSHKTEFAGLAQFKSNLRVSALDWMKKYRFFDTDDGLNLSRQDVYFESTRRSKIERIKTLKCTHFIDDLEETFLEDTFPTNVQKVLYAPYGQHLSLPDATIAVSWKEISDHIFSSRV
jgi:hypothetical protein